MTSYTAEPLISEGTNVHTASSWESELLVTVYEGSYLPLLVQNWHPSLYWQPYKISGVTRDSSGNPLGGCTVMVIPLNGIGIVQQVVSDENGNYTLYVDNSNKQYFVVAFKSGTPNVFGRTDQNIVGEPS